ncbi:hypothetical protein [Mesorhizobium sp. SP-1A]|uniref:hypothetical protein n=1 Tax=Mesorhizobium sp. SP-1A TaxID=3077840 RepID=UPI0028F6E650|nr:hypothetical protein [Mesorhizobium sp. SP-1A]
MTRALRVLVGCEFSGVVRRAFAARGHDAWSCDLLPAEDGSNRHIVGDVRDHLGDGWDLLVVAHPPCTRLCRSGRRWLSGPGKMTPPKKLPRGRSWESMIAEFENGVDLFVACWRAPIARVAVENPEMHDLARARMPADLPAPQLVETNRLPEPERGSDEWKAWNRVWRMPPGAARGHERSRFFSGMADAMADQWGGLADDLLEVAE